MKKLSLIFSTIMLSFSLCQSMEIEQIAYANLDTLPAEALIEINYHLNGQEIDGRKSINALRCVNNSCNKNAPTQEELNNNFIRVISKALEDDNGVPLRYWKRYGAYPEKIFLNFLETDKKDCARFIYSEFGLNNDDMLEMAAKYNNMKAGKLLIADYYAYDATRAFVMALTCGFKELATMLRTEHNAQPLQALKTAANKGNMYLFDLLIECQDFVESDLSEALLLAAQNGHHALVKKAIFTTRFDDKTIFKKLVEAAKTHNHSELVLWLENYMNIAAIESDVQK